MSIPYFGSCPERLAAFKKCCFYQLMTRVWSLETRVSLINQLDLKFKVYNDLIQISGMLHPVFNYAAAVRVADGSAQGALQERIRSFHPALIHPVEHAALCCDVSSKSML